MSFLKEFKTFAMRGNVVDMAVGIIIGGAFGKIVSSLVSDIIMPPIGLLIGGVKFESLKIVRNMHIPMPLQEKSLKPSVSITAILSIQPGFSDYRLFYLLIRQADQQYEKKRRN